MSTITEGKTAPGFALSGTDGARHALADALKNGPVVAAFFKVSCPVCQFTFPFLERLHEAYGNDHVTVWGISQDDATDTKDFWKEYGLSFPWLLDDDGYPVSNQYGLMNVPTVYLIAPDGKVKVASIGFSKQDLEKISAELGRHAGRPAAKVFLPGESIPDYKPG